MIQTLSLQVPHLLFGPGSLSQLSNELKILGIHHPLIVTDKGVKQAGLLTKTIDACGSEAKTSIFDQVTENPLFSDVEKGLHIYKESACDSVIALGGGSVIDTAKIIALLGKNKGEASNYLGVPNAIHGQSAPLIVIPTTAGTGSEASHSAGLHPDAIKPSVGMSSRYLIPKLAILDPDLTKSLPKHLTAATGIDALSHCIEGFFSKKEIPLGKNLALEGIKLATKHLKNATINQDDENARAQMMLSAFCGGISIGMGLGPAHAIAITCSDQGFHHGILSGIGLIETLQTTCAQIPDKAKEVAQAMGLKPDITLAQGLKELMRELELPCNLFELGYKSKDLSNLAVLAHKSHFNIFAPYHPTISEYTGMLKKSLNID